MGHSSKAGENIFWAMNRNKPGIIKRILNALERFIARIRGKDAYLVVEQRQAAERLRDMLTGELRRAYGTDVKGEAAAESDGGKRYSIVYLDDGKTYVTASRNVISGNDVNQWRKQITNFFNALLEGNKSIDIETVEGDTLTITKKETARKARDNFKQENGKPVRMSDDEFRVKLNVEAHIDEIAETARSGKNIGSADTKSHAFAKDGFTYRTAYFEDFNGDYYRVRLSIGNNGTVATVYNVGKMTKDVPASAKILAVVGSKPLAVTSSDNSISQDSRNVNRQLSEISDAKMIEDGGTVENDSGEFVAESDGNGGTRWSLSTYESSGRETLRQYQLFAGKYIKINSSTTKRIITGLPFSKEIFRAADCLYFIRRRGFITPVQNKPLCPHGGDAVCSVLGSGYNIHSVLSEFRSKYKQIFPLPVLLIGIKVLFMNDKIPHFPFSQDIFVVYKRIVDVVTSSELFF